MASVGALAGAVPAAAADGRVRGVDPRSQALVAKAGKASPTVAALLVALDQTDVVVQVQVTFVPNALGGDLRLLTVVVGSRYLLVRVDTTRSPEEQIGFLGHELRHAQEVAGAADVQDEAGLARLMARIGRATGRGTFETDAAVQVSRQVRRELGNGRE
jgi:hypothetical protein